MISITSFYLAIFCSLAFQQPPMGLLNRLRGKKDDTIEKVKEQTTPQPTHPTNAPPPPGRTIKRYTSEVKPIYELILTILAPILLHPLIVQGGRYLIYSNQVRQKHCAIVFIDLIFLPYLKIENFDNCSKNVCRIYAYGFNKL